MTVVKWPRIPHASRLLNHLPIGFTVYQSQLGRHAADGLVDCSHLLLVGFFAATEVEVADSAVVAPLHDFLEHKNARGMGALFGVNGKFGHDDITVRQIKECKGRRLAVNLEYEKNSLVEFAEPQCFHSPNVS